MTLRGAAGGVVAVAVLTAAAAGCADTEGIPTAESEATRSAPATTRTTTTTTATTATTTAGAASPAPTGPPLGTATMKVTGADRATIRYRINGAAEQVLPDVALPWEMPYPVFDKVQSSFSADGGDTALTCSIIMDGMLAAFTTEPRPTCSFAYY
jgi:hypothetical protein